VKVLLVVRGKGRSVYVGRDVMVTVLDVRAEGEARAAEILVHHPMHIGVSAPGVSMAAHVEEQYRAERAPKGGEAMRTAFVVKRGEAVLIGRGVTVVVSGFDGSDEVRLGIEAPRHMAVSRDDFTFDEHMTFQARREAGARG
jgi:sRNA-binding carbon storage regulator CsrA